MSAMQVPPESPHADRLVGTRRIVTVMGTVFTLDLRDLDPASAAVDEVVACWHWVDDTFSTYKPASQISRLAAGSLSLNNCAPEVGEVLAMCEGAAEISGGYFTDRPSGQLDPSGMVKGWSVDVASRMLQQAGSLNHCISAGGDVWCIGTPGVGETWRVGVVDPRDGSRVLAVVAPASGQDQRLAVATSGTAQRGRHIINPHTGLAPDDLAAITVVGGDVTLVDWVATAAFAMGHDSRNWLEAMAGIDALAVTPEGDCWSTTGFEEIGALVCTPLDAGVR